MKVILISGKQGSGKSTLAKNLFRGLGDNNPVFLLKFADPLYRMHEAIRHVAEEYGIPFDQKEGVLLQLLGTEWGRKQKGVDVWANACVHDVAEKSMQYPGSIFIIDDCRFPNELAAFPNALKIRLCAPEETRKARTESWRDNTNHESEIALDGYEKYPHFDICFVQPAGSKPDDPIYIANYVLEMARKKWGVKCAFL